MTDRSDTKGIKGLVLTGGKSIRMGFDKSLINYHGKPQREFLFSLLSKFCSEVFVSCKQGTDIPENLNPLADHYDFDSPLNGILTAFEIYPASVWLAVAVDMPGVNETTLDYLLQHRDKSKTATCFLDSDGKNPEPLLTIWEPECYPLLKDFYKSGNISPRKFLQQHDIHMLTVPDKKMLLNINSDDDLKRYHS